MKEIRLYGHLRKFGRSFNLDVRNPGEAVRALCAILPGFQKHILDHNEPGYKIFAEGTSIDAEGLNIPRGGDVIRIVPVVSGANKGIGRILVGAALIGASFIPGLQAVSLLSRTFNIASTIGGIGSALVLGGVASLLFSPPKSSGPQESPENRPGFAFDGPVNTVREGGAIPVGYGRLWVGSQVISSGLRTVDVPV